MDNAFNLRDLVLQELVKIIMVCYIKNLRLKFKCGIFFIQLLLLRFNSLQRGLSLHTTEKKSLVSLLGQ